MLIVAKWLRNIWILQLKYKLANSCIIRLYFHVICRPCLHLTWVWWCLFVSVSIHSKSSTWLRVPYLKMSSSLWWTNYLMTFLPSQTSKWSKLMFLLHMVIMVHVSHAIYCLCGGYLLSGIPKMLNGLKSPLKADNNLKSMTNWHISNPPT